jgi:SAM-dependent methyltransferase
MQKIKYVHTREMHNLNAAREIVPIILDMFSPKSVIDIGCGIGSWLKVFKDLGVSNILGVDGEYVKKDLLYIKKNEFIPADLSKNFNIKKRYDIVLALEVAEHISEKDSDTFIENLVNHGNLILFSAAVPFQGGQNHLNEQWPEYWHTKFKKFGYSVYDVIRPKIWDNDKIEYFYKQNMFVYAKNNFFKLKEDIFAKAYIHPYLWEFHNRTTNKQLTYLKKRIIEYEEGYIGICLSIQILRKAIRKKIHNFFSKL